MFVDGGEVTTGPDGGVPVPVAVLVGLPESISAWVVTYVAVHVTDAPGATDAAPAGHVTADKVPVPVNAPSTGATLVRVVFPVLVIAKL